MNASPQLRLELTLDEVNAVLVALGKMPYEQVFELVAKIQQQAGPQLSGRVAESNAE